MAPVVRFVKRTLACFLVLGISCSRSQVPVFDAARAFSILEKQCSFGPRNPGSEGHKKCLAYLESELRLYADAVVRQPFRWTSPHDGKTHTLTNLVSSFGMSGERILLCAHWDTRPYADFDPVPANRQKPILGANDGASGVAILLEIARNLKARRPRTGVDIVLFDGEDSGLEGESDTWCEGSRYFARNRQLSYQPQYAILVDMVGDRDLRLPVEKGSQRYAPDIVNRVWNKASELGLYAFEKTSGPEVVDDHLRLLEAGIPAINIIDFDYPYWHTLADTPDKCSAESLEMVGTLLLHILYE